MTLECDFDDGHAGEGAFGLIVLKTDETLEVESRTVFARARRACYHTRIESHDRVTRETLAQMAADLPTAAALLPAGVPFGAIGYGCTSGATVIGPARVAAMIGTAHPGAAATDPISAVMAALGALGLGRIGLLTPYVPEVTQSMHALLEENGFAIALVGAFNQIEDRKIARISEQSTLAAITQIGSDPACEAVFASCTNLRTFGILDQAEAAIGKPVISSNLALCWHLLKLGGVSTRGLGPGRLFAS